MKIKKRRIYTGLWTRRVETWLHLYFHLRRKGDQEAHDESSSEAIMNSRGRWK